MIFVIVKNNYVVDRIIADASFTYPHPHDVMLEDVGACIHIGDWYEEAEGIFYRPITGTPPDWPTELIPTDGEGAYNP